jgi:hypothetical protein
MGMPVAMPAFGVLDRVGKPSQAVVGLNVELCRCGATDLDRLGHVLTALFRRCVLQRARSAGEEVEEKPVDLFGGFPLQPVACSIEPFVAPRSGDELGGASHSLLDRSEVA